MPRASSTRRSTRRSRRSGWRRPVSGCASCRATAAPGSRPSAIINGLQADVATLGSSYDMQQLYQRAQLIPADWAARLPDNSAPYTSTIVFLVREGNPKNIRDWDDLIRPGVQVITPNPKTSGGSALGVPGGLGLGRASARRQRGQRPGLRASSSTSTCRCSTPARRGATDTFVERGIGDVLLSWESEALLAEQPTRPRQVRDRDAVAEHPGRAAASRVVDKVVDQRGTRTIAQAYLQFLYTQAGPADHRAEFLPPARPRCRAAICRRSSRRS